MRHLIFNNTPAHVHLYKHAIRRLVDRGHDVLVLGRDDGCATALLDRYSLPHAVYGRKGPTKASLVRELPAQLFTLGRLARDHDPDLIFGRGAYAAFAGLVTGARTFLVLDSVPWRLGYVLPSRAADAVLTTRAFRDDLGEHHHRFDGLTELAYLHPDVFEPDPAVREDLGVAPDEQFAFVRFNGFGAVHDVGETGFTVAQARELVERLAGYVTVFVSDEAERLDLGGMPARPYDLHPARIHDALAAARLFVADAHTMITEAALLGTPAIRATPHDRDSDMGEFYQLEDNGLVRNLPPSAVIREAVSLLEDEAAPERWLDRRDEFASDRVNLTAFIVAVAEHPDRAGELAAATFEDGDLAAADHPRSASSR